MCVYYLVERGKDSDGKVLMENGRVQLEIFFTGNLLCQKSTGDDGRTETWAVPQMNVDRNSA